MHTRISFKKGRNLFLHHEMFFLVLILVVSLVVTTGIFLLLWSYFKLGLAWLVCFGVFFLVRKTNIWKFGLEIHHTLIFLTTYAFGWLFSVPLFLATILLVIKIRPDEFEGGTINIICLFILTVLTTKVASTFGPNLSIHTFLWASLIVISITIILDALLTLRIYPGLWMKLVMTHFLDFFVQYSIITAFGYPLLHFFLSLV